MVNLYYCLKEYLKEDNFSISLNDYNINSAGSVAILFRDGGSAYRELSTGKYINNIFRYEIVGVAGRTKTEIIAMELYLKRVKEKLEVLNNKNLIGENGEQVFIISTTTSNINYLGKNRQEVATFSLNGLIIY